MPGSIALQGHFQTFFTGLLFCYLPLAAVVIGLLVAFCFTDWHARRPYQRTDPALMQRADPVELQLHPIPDGPAPTKPIGTEGPPFAVYGDE